MRPSPKKARQMDSVEIDKNRIASLLDSSGKSSKSDDSQESQKSAPVSSLIPNILVVDDDSGIRSQLVRLYTHSGYTVVPVPSAEDALKQLADGNIDFVITDIKLPGMDGVELVAHMQENYPDVPVIAITGYSNIETAINVLKRGACDFVVKPFDLGSVQESTRAALEKTPCLHGDSPPASLSQRWLRVRWHAQQNRRDAPPI